MASSLLKLRWCFQVGAGGFETYAEFSGSWRDASGCEGEVSTFNVLQDKFSTFTLTSQTFLGGLWTVETRTDGQEEASHILAVATQQDEALHLDVGGGSLSGSISAADVLQKHDVTLTASACSGSSNIVSLVGQMSSTQMQGTVETRDQVAGTWLAKRILNHSAFRLPSSFLQRAARWTGSKMFVRP